MFDAALPEVDGLAQLSDAKLIDAAGGWARSENSACAHKLAVMAEIFARRTGLPAGEREDWWIDPEAAVVAELAAAQNVTRSMALHQTHRGVVLRDRLPKVAELFRAGLISEMLVRTIVFRTDLINDDAAMAAVDAELADQITEWGAKSIAKTEQAIDALVDRHDPGALRRSRDSAASRHVRFGSRADAPGFTSMWARLYAPDAAIVEKCVQEMAYSVCERDPRSAGERRADALTALVAGTVLACRCGADDCEAAGRGDAPAKDTVVYVIAEANTVTDACHGKPGRPADEVPAAEDEAQVAETGTTRPRAAGLAFVFGAGMVPGLLLGGLATGARFQTIIHPGQTAPEPRYCPSRALADFVRCRDLTCRFPGCEKPATESDIDHTVPYPAGPTHASNLKILCRFHHLLKTFWTGDRGWQDRQLPDGTVIWTSPTGHTYTTRPGGAALFPALSPPTGELWNGNPPAPDEDDRRGVMMPRRRRTRAAYRARAVAAERRLNDAHVAERNRPPPF